MCTYQNICYWVWVNEDGTETFFKKHFQDDYMFGMRQLKCLNLSQITFKYVDILPAKFDFEKVKQNKVRELTESCSQGSVV